MKRILKGLALLALMGAITFSGFLLVYSQLRGGGEDLKRLKEYAKLLLFSQGLIESLSQKEIYRLYQRKCYRKCHGEASMITAVLPPAGWMQIVERMRVQQGVEMTGSEAEAIIRYLDLKYTVHRSSVPYRIRREINRLLWRNDVGYGDLYVDVIYGTQVYFDSINASSLATEYGVDNSFVFVISLTVHDGRVKHYPLHEMAALEVDNMKYAPLEEWSRRFETADGHHLEGILRFPKRDQDGKELIPSGAAKTIKLKLKNLETKKDRIYEWDLPIPYPKEYKNESLEN